MSLYSTIQDLNQVLPHIDSQTLVVLDIEGLLIIETGYLGPNQAVLARPEAKVAFNAIHHQADWVIGLTARIFRGDHDTTQSVMKHLLGHTFKGWEDVTIPMGNHTGFYASCLFSGGASKGHSLLQFLQEPIITSTLEEKGIQKVVFVDDRLSNCQDVSLMLSSHLSLLPINTFQVFYCPPS